jgi:hypothetical protein
MDSTQDGGWMRDRKPTLLDLKVDDAIDRSRMSILSKAMHSPYAQISVSSMW